LTDLTYLLKKAVDRYILPGFIINAGQVLLFPGPARTKQGRLMDVK